MNVSTDVQLGGGQLSNGVWIRVHRCVGAVAGVCEVTVPATVGADAAPGDAVSATLGAGDDAAGVFRGELDAVVSRGDHRVFRAFDARVAAGRMRVDELFEEQTSDDIVRQLAGEAGMTVGRLATGVLVQSYLADDGRSVLGHMDHLCDLGGAHLYVDVDGSLRAASYIPGPPALQLAYGAHLLSVASADRQGGGPVEVRTEGAASVRGPQAASWPTTDTASVAGVMRLGSGSEQRRWIPELRAMVGALAVATSTALRRQQRTRRVTLMCLGLAGVELADAVIVRDVPGDGSILVLRVVAIEHRVNPWEGFVTELVLEGAIS